jgi:HD-like signal output (HDOD) protein
MNMLLPALLALLLVVGVVVMRWLRRSKPPAPVRRPAPRDPAPPVAAAPAQAAPVLPHTLPPELAAFRLVPAHELVAARTEALVQVFQHVPRPPKLMHHLLSPAFFSSASAVELVDLIRAEPLIAARVLATVNSPLYGLRSPVQSIGQAVTYLGLDAVRSLCLQYILVDAFKADSPERQQVLDSTWRASALGSELMQHLARELGVPDPGPLVSAVVLSFLGRLATAAALPRKLLAQVPRHGLLPRLVAEQQILHLASPEIGRLLMRHWGLPEAIVDDAAGIDAVLLTPADPAHTGQHLRAALGYLCARLGEQLADGQRADLAGFTLPNADEPDWHHLRSHLDPALQARVLAALQGPALTAALARLQQGLGSADGDAPVVVQPKARRQAVSGPA